MDGAPPLHRLAMAGKVERLHELLEAGVRVDTQNRVRAPGPATRRAGACRARLARGDWGRRAGLGQGNEGWRKFMGCEGCARACALEGVSCDL